MTGFAFQRIGFVIFSAAAALPPLIPNDPATQANPSTLPVLPRETTVVERFGDEIRRFAEWDRKNSSPRDAVLFVGSSSIRMWPTREAFPAWPVINRGFGGSTIADVSHYFTRVVAPYHPRVIVFYAGDNDIAAGRTPEQVRDDFEAFMKLVRAGARATSTTQPREAAPPVVFVSIKPSEFRWQYWPAMQRANALIRAMSASTPGLVYVDAAAPLLDSAGKPQAVMYVEDRLHLSAAGYAEWKKILEPVVERLLAGR